MRFGAKVAVMHSVRYFRPSRIAAAIVLALLSTASADPRPGPPAEAASTEEIVAAAQIRKGFGLVESATLQGAGRKIFAVWYCPFSGRNDCYLHAYYFDFATQTWIRFIDQLVRGSHSLSAEMPEGEAKLIFRGSSGQIAFEQSVDELPAK